MTGTLLELVSALAPRSRDFRQLASQCFGAWPVSIVEVLEKLSSMPGPLRETALRLLQDAEQGSADRLDPVEGLPLEHPLDGDWRFASGVPDALVWRLLTHAGSGGRILLACAPTVVLATARIGVSHRVVVAVRWGDPVFEALRALVPQARYVDFDETDGMDAAAGLIDPPWYDDVATPLVQRVANGVRSSGILYICGPDLMTAPSNAKGLTGARASLYAGLVPNGRAWRVRYRTPMFEARSMEAAGIRSVPSSWRTGLLRQFVRTHTEIEVRSPLEPETSWTETTFGKGRLWLRPSAARGGKPIVLVSDSVSRTSPIREDAAAWTSANTVVVGGTEADILSLRDVASPLRAKLTDMDHESCWRERERDP